MDFVLFMKVHQPLQQFLQNDGDVGLGDRPRLQLNINKNNPRQVPNQRKNPPDNTP